MKNKKPINAKEHGIIDYAFSASQLILPQQLGLNKKAVKTYQTLGLGFLAVNCLTDTPVGIKPLLTFREHKLADAGFLTGLTLLTFYRPIRKKKKTLTFHLGFLAIAAAHYMLTDYKSRQ